MAARALMFQGTGSDVGKSLMVAGLCRLLSRRGLCVAPFKAQNMSNNAAVTADGGEIGRAQWLQALAAGIEPSVHMNPVLLKPQSDHTSQVILRGKHVATMAASDYHHYRRELLPKVLESYHTLASQTDIILVEGAGSPAEINLRSNDIANMGFAQAARCPVVLIGDIDRGGVIASIVGTHTVLAEEDRALIRGFIVNKFRGDATLFATGAADIERFTGWKNLGLVPHHPALAKLPQEDSLALRQTQKTSGATALKIAVLTYPHIANFDDLDPLQNDPSVTLTWCRPGDVIPPDAKAVILPGSKATITDLAFVKAQGWDIDLRAHQRRGGHIIGICGGFQMLGNTLADPKGIEGTTTHADGLGLLDIDTIFTAEKTVTPWQGTHIATHTSASGYEIHLGYSSGPACDRPVFENAHGKDGATSTDGRVWGSYIHGMFGNDVFRQTFLGQLGATASPYAYQEHMQQILNGWADVLEQSLAIETLLALAAPI